MKIVSNNLLNTKLKVKTASFDYGFDKNGMPVPKANTGREDSYWINSDGEVKDITKAKDQYNTLVGSEELETTSDLKKKGSLPQTGYGLEIENNYKSDDEKYGNGQHGGFYDITIDPYKMIEGFIDECYKRWEYQDEYLKYLNSQINKLWNYVANQSSDKGIGKVLKQLIDLINTDTSMNLSTSTISSIPEANLDKLSVITGLTGMPTDDKKIPVGNINIYSGDESNNKGIFSHKPHSSAQNNDIKAK